MAASYVILVEDSLADAELARAALERTELDVEVVHKYSCEDARTMLGTLFARQPPVGNVLLLLDLNLPGGDSLDFLRWLKSDPNTRVLPAVVFSGSLDPTKVRAALEAHANAFVSKAGNVDQFMDRVGSVATAFLSHTLLPGPRCAMD